MNCSAPRYFFVFLIISISLTACNKEYAPVPSATEQNIIYLTGSNGAYSDWKLNTLAIGNTNQPMTPPLSDYSIIYYLNGTFKDSDGMKGTWALINKDSISQKITNAANGVYAVQGYRIVNLNATQLTVSYSANGKSVNAAYVAER